ncbi:MAG: hypothetical protein HOP19_16030 [Acidobacteria bacterium]|nr:hypothetical protein [Acidobacteriota bacterium]
MQQDSKFLSILEPDLDQFVYGAATERGVRRNLLQFLVEKLIAARPINLRVCCRKKELERGLKE